jgi:hypothetical protein
MPGLLLARGLFAEPLQPISFGEDYGQGSAFRNVPLWSSTEASQIQGSAKPYSRTKVQSFRENIAGENRYGGRHGSENSELGRQNRKTARFH